MIIITGTQRSGTSFMAKFLKLCGYNLGTEFWDDRINGGLENPDICNFYRDTLGSEMFPFSTYWEMIGQDTFHSFINLHKYTEIAKFSYLLASPKLVDMWAASRGTGDHFLIMDRPAQQVIASKEHYPEFFEEDWVGLPRTISGLIKMRQASIARMDFYGMSYEIMPFPVPSGNYVIGTLRRIFELELPGNVEKIWEDYYDPDKIHKYE